MTSFRLALAALGVAVAVAPPVPAQEKAQPGPVVDFARDIIPILQRSCFECHGPEKQKGKLRLDSRAAALRGGQSGPALVPGQAERSELYRRITLTRADDGVMPARGELLAPAQAGLLRRWIDQGAVWPEKVQTVRHWAWLAPVRPPLPALSDRHWPRNPIDHFILARLEKEGLRPSPEADRAVLLRRVTLDLTGLPPTPAEVDAFLADRAPDAYEKVIDRLLASPQFGQRWARPWLDLARYADSHGFQHDDLRPLWAYRDWVITALNQDMPFDRFTIEQLAGDLLPDATEAQRIATGFHRSAPTNVEAGSDPEETRVNQIIDRVNTTAAVWLGVTLECAQCHDHKYDPFTQKEYYQLFAWFNNTAIEADRANPKVPGSIKFLGPTLPLRTDDKTAEREKLTDQIRELDRKLANRRKELMAGLDTREKGLTGAMKTARLQQLLAKDSEAGLLRQKRAQAEQSLRAVAPPSTLVMQELPRPRKTVLFGRGDFRAPGAAVAAGTPAVLHRAVKGPPNRLTLARWLVARDNPLAARVHANRLWAELFGRGIVSTVEDFGVKGEPPTHPELLDWLAVDFMDGGWSVKRLLRTMATSATYRQSSRLTPELRARDEANKLCARGPRFRMDAEMVRDNALAVAGLLSLEQGGPPIRPYQPEGLWTKVGGDRVDYLLSPIPDRYNRGIYVVWKRASPYPSFVNFDATARLACTVKRSRSNTPLQALTLLNDPVYVEAAAALAQRLLSETGEASDIARLRYAFRLCLAREPRDPEVRVLRQLLDQQRASSVADSKAVENLLAGFQKLNSTLSVPSGYAPGEFAAWYAVATVLLNLDETITKG
jgi:hypothetical protein